MIASPRDLLYDRPRWERTKYLKWEEGEEERKGDRGRGEEGEIEGEGESKRKRGKKEHGDRRSVRIMMKVIELLLNIINYYSLLLLYYTIKGGGVYHVHVHDIWSTIFKYSNSQHKL